jgi:hypothetical protein
MLCCKTPPSEIKLVQKFTWGNDTGVIDPVGEVLSVAGDQKIGLASLSALQQAIVFLIWRNREALSRIDQFANLFEACDQRLASLDLTREFGADEHIPIFSEDFVREA